MLWSRHGHDEVTLHRGRLRADRRQPLAEAVSDRIAEQTLAARQAPIGDVAVLFEDYESHPEANVLRIAQLDRIPPAQRAAAHARVELDRIPLARRAAAHARVEHRAWLDGSSPTASPSRARRGSTR